MRNPLQPFLDLRRRELPFAFSMFAYFFLVIASFWILKPLKKSLFIRYYDRIGGFDFLVWTMRGSQAELLAKVLNMFVAAGAVAVFSLLSHRFRRERMAFVVTLFFMAGYVVYAFAIPSPGPLVVWTFYLFGDLFSTLMVVTFFAFLNDSVSTSRARRLYGPVGIGGVLGGVFGTTFLSAWIGDVGIAQWMWVCFGIGVAILVNAALAGRWLTMLPENGDGHDEPRVPRQSNLALGGARLVMRSSYLLAIAAIVAVYEIVSTVMDFQFTATIEYYLTGQAIARQFTTVYMITNWVSLLVQVFLTGFVMTRFGLLAALLVLPSTVFLGSSAFMIVPALWVGSLLNTADNGFSYSINQSAKEALYVPTTVEEKYKAKAFIDMFVQRFAKVVAIGVSLLITLIFRDFSTMRWLSIFTLLMVGVWLVCAHHAGRTCEGVGARGEPGHKWHPHMDRGRT